jgi:hypothetical protein
VAGGWLAGLRGYGACFGLAALLAFGAAGGVWRLRHRLDPAPSSRPDIC